MSNSRSDGHSHSAGSRLASALIAGALSFTPATCSSLGSAKPGTVIMIDMQSPGVWVQVVFGAGSASDPSGKEGLAAFTANALKRGSSAHPRPQIDSILTALSARLDLMTDRDVTILDGYCPSAGWNAYAELLLSVLTEPMFDSTQMRSLMADQLAALDTLRSADAALAQAAVQYYIYRDHPYGHPPLGFDHSIRTLAAADAKEFHHRFYTRGNYVLGLAGAIPSGTAESLNRRLQEHLSPGRPSVPALPSPAQPEGLNVHVIERPGCDRATIRLARPADVLRGDPDFTPLETALSCLTTRGVSKSGLDQTLRVERGLVEGFDAFIEHRQESGQQDEGGVTMPRREQYVDIGTSTTPINAAWAIRIMLRDLSQAAQNGLSQPDLDRAGELLTVQRPTGPDSLASQMRDALRLLWLRVRPGASERVTPDMARRSIGRALDPRHMVIVVVVPAGQAFCTDLLQSPIKYQYPQNIDAAAIRLNDRYYVAFQPRWDVNKFRIVTSSEMFR